MLTQVGFSSIQEPDELSQEDRPTMFGVESRSIVRLDKLCLQGGATGRAGCH